MIIATLGSAMLYYISTQTMDIAEQPPGTVYYARPDSLKSGMMSFYHEPPVQIKPLVESQFRGVVKQAYDYSCGSAALTTVLNGYLGMNLTERATMNGLLRFGEYQRIIERRSFSLLDMKRLVTALGYNSGGFKGSITDLMELDKPVIVPIEYAGFKHFVVYKGAKDGRIFLADPALGNISFTVSHFQDVWFDNTLYMIMPTENQPTANLLAISDQDMRVVDDATVNLYAFAEVSFPDAAMQRQVDRASTLQRVRDTDPNSTTYEQPIDMALRLYYRRK